MARKIFVVATLLTAFGWFFLSRPSPPPSSLAQSHSTNDLETRLRGFIPQRLVQLAQEIGQEEGTPLPIGLTFQRADLDGSGQFSFIVAAYTHIGGGTMRVLRDLDGQLEVVSDLDPEVDVGGSSFQMELVDVEGDGRPEFVTRGYGANVHYTLSVFGWTGNALRLLTGGADTGDAELEDVDGDGILEIVTPPDCDEGPDPDSAPPCANPWKVYRFNGLAFELASTSSTPPGTGEGPPAFAMTTRLTPERFPLAEVQRASQPAAAHGGVVTLRLGNLMSPRSGGLPARPDVSDIDLNTLVLGRTMRPLRTQILPASAQERGQGEAGGFKGDFLQAEFDRQAVLQFLPRTQLNKPLEAGDKLTLELRGKMRNRAPLRTTVTVEIGAR